jgi:hypothetical protein
MRATYLAHIGMWYAQTQYELVQDSGVRTLSGILLQRCKCKFGDNIKMVIQVLVWKDVGWIYLAQNRIQWQARFVSPYYGFC